ncbi:MAG: hypothetical protein IPL22_22770 [Bacteroidetes bacterium]|nr:hypothetical protein [Bacteroidota bacterium]
MSLIKDKDGTKQGIIEKLEPLISKNKIAHAANKGFVQLGHDVETIIGSAIQALVSADGILLSSSSKLQLLVINLASVPGRLLVNSPTAQSLELGVILK